MHRRCLCCFFRLHTTQHLQASAELVPFASSTGNIVLCLCHRLRLSPAVVLQVFGQVQPDLLTSASGMHMPTHLIARSTHANHLFVIATSCLAAGV
jgi:hypothetical protein